VKEVHARDYDRLLFPMGRERAASHRLLWQIIRFTAIMFAAIGVIGFAFG